MIILQKPGIWNIKDLATSYNPKQNGLAEKRLMGGVLKTIAGLVALLTKPTKPELYLLVFMANSDA